MQSETFSKIISLQSKQTLSIHNDKWFKGYCLLKTMLDIAIEIENLSMELYSVRPWRLQELEYRLELLPAE